LIGLVDLLEFIMRPLILFRRLPLTLQYVRVMLFGLREELLLDLLGRGLATHTQNLIVVLLKRELKLWLLGAHPPVSKSQQRLRSTRGAVLGEQVKDFHF
jgi:hypothetical protein